MTARPIADNAELRTEVREVDVRRLRLLQRNARFMRHETFQRLVENVRRDGVLTQIPVARWVGKGSPNLDALEDWEVPSGNHRVQAAISADRWMQPVQFILDPISRDRAMGLQLSHNAISGEDDPAILAELYDEIQSVDFREYAGLDDQVLGLLDEVKIGALSEANLDFQTVVMLFLPTDLERARAAIDDALATASSGDESWLVRFEDFNRTLEMLDIVGKAHDVKNTAMAFGLLLDLFEEHVTELVGDWWDGSEVREHRQRDWVPTPTIVGYDMPAEAAGVVRQAIDRMIARGDASHAWQAVEFLAAEYLAQP